MRTIGASSRVLAAAACVAGCWLQAAAQSNAVVSGTLRETGSFGYDETIVFSCTGLPTCTGTYTNTIRHEHCSNFNTFSGPFTITGLNLAASGPISGTLTFAGLRDSISNPGATTCVLGPATGSETVDGATVTKQIARQVFSSPAFACQ
jgi:hypothetical protein